MARWKKFSARAAERRGEIELAAQEYEAYLADNADDAEALIDLAVLYWQATDYGFLGTHGLTDAFVDQAADRCSLLLQRAVLEHPDHPAGQFWTRYTRFIDVGGSEITPEECREIMRVHPDYLEPAMILFDGVQARVEAALLLLQCRAQRTVRADYVASIVEGKEVARLGEVERRPGA